MRRTFECLIISLLLVSSQAFSQPTAPDEKNAYEHIRANIFVNRSDRGRFFRRDVFDYSTQIFPMKSFFIRNATIRSAYDSARHVSRAVKPLECVNTVRAGLEILFYGSSEIAQYRRPTTSRPLVALTGENRIVDVMEQLSDLGCINDYRDVYFFGKNKHGDTIIINEQNFSIPGNFDDSADIINMAGSVWHALLSMVPKAKGWSIFTASISNGYHSVTLLVNHTGLVPEVYWADQTEHHPVADANRIAIPYSRQYGWERFTEFSSTYRGLDDYCLYAVRTFLFDKADNKHMPVIRLFKISLPSYL